MAVVQWGLAFGRGLGVEHCGTVFYFAFACSMEGTVSSALSLPERVGLCLLILSSPLSLSSPCRRLWHRSSSHFAAAPHAARRTPHYRLSVYPRALPESTHPGCCNCWQCRRTRGSKRGRERMPRDTISHFGPRQPNERVRRTAAAYELTRECRRVRRVRSRESTTYLPTCHLLVVVIAPAANSWICVAMSPQWCA